ncbi:DUF6011 domain-containing protein [Amycolatopsis sp. VS8301801F10]|uniref:DUF6011 domain-containing protein n=1 Tax=unclassified Amycolatopsis TaxID=2618356 RepID=UPI0038FCE1F3
MTARCKAAKCGRPLRSEKSKKRGYGPVCWGREHPTVPSGPVTADHPVDPNQILLPLGVSTVDAETRKQAIDTVARHALFRKLRLAVTCGEILWEDYPEIDERDWNLVLERVLAIATSMRPADEQYRVAYEHLTGVTVEDGGAAK